MITGFQAQMRSTTPAPAPRRRGGRPSSRADHVQPARRLEANKFDATELDQQVGSAADPYERELPTGLIKMGPTKAEIKYTKANYQRLQALAGASGTRSS
jgi:hypothetical protein